MRIGKWLLGIAAGLLLLFVALVLIVTLLVDPNRFKPRIEKLVQDTTGQPFRIHGDLDISWYPWLALQMGAAQLGEGRPLLQWHEAKVGARLFPLLRGELVIDRVRLEGLRLRLERMADGHANWEPLLSARQQSGASHASPEIAGLEIRNGALEYLDATDATHICFSDWKLDVSEWKSNKPFPLQSQFEVRLAGAQIAGSIVLNGVEPLDVQGNLSVATKSLRKLLEGLSVGGPRPASADALAAMNMTAQWAANGGAVVVKPIELQVDQTHLKGEMGRSAGAAALWSFRLEGDRIDLDRYVALEDTDSEPFELPTAALKALRAQGVLSFAEANLATAHMKDVRMSLQLQDGRVSGSKSQDAP